MSMFKYVVLDVSVSENLRMEMPFIFPKEITHSDFAQFLDHYLAQKHDWFVQENVSAGFVTLPSCQCHGDSETLGKKSRGERDTILIMDYGYGGGLT